MREFVTHANEQLTLPECGVTLHVLSVDGGEVRIAVDDQANMALKPARSESAAAPGDRLVAGSPSIAAPSRLPRQQRHEFRNELQSIRVGVQLYAEQVRRGLEADAADTLDIIRQSLAALENSAALSHDEPAHPVSP